MTYKPEARARVVDTLARASGWSKRERRAVQATHPHASTVPSSDTELSLHVVRDFDALQALAPAWEALLRASASDEPMLGPDWLLTWWRVYGAASGRQLAVGLFRDGDRLVGLAPLCRRLHWHSPGIPMRRLEFLGADVSEGDGVCSEYLNVIARAGDEPRVAGAFAAAVLRGDFGGWGEVVLDVLDGSGPMPGLLVEAFAALGTPTTQEVTTESPYLTLPASWDEYLRGMLNKHKRRNVTSALREFEAWAGSDWQIERVTSADELPRGQAILHELHNQRWQGEGGDGAFARPRFAAFHDDYMRRLLDRGELGLLWLSVRGQPIAAHYQIVANGKVYYYQCGRRLDVPPRVRPGVVLLALALQEAIARGLREFDFLGGPARYKMQLTTTTRPLVRLRIARNGPTEWLRRGAEAARACVRAVRQRLTRRVNDG